MSTYWRGAYLDDRTAAMMEQTTRILGSAYNVRPTQGSYSGGVAASGGTHDGGGAIDLAGQDAGMDTAERNGIRDAMRQVGFAAWVRTPDQSDWPYHIHGIAVQPGGKDDRGCLSSGAHGQVIDYFEGRNGLASGAPDDGPRDWVGVTWETYEQGEEFMSISADELISMLRSEGISGSADPNVNGSNAVVSKLQNVWEQEFSANRSEGISGSADPNVNGNQRIVDAINALGTQRTSASHLSALAFSVVANLLTLIVLIAVVTGRVTG